MHNRDFEQPLMVGHDRGRKRKATETEPRQGGFFYSGLTPELQQSLVDFARHAAAGARADGRLALQAHDNEKLAKREERLITLLNAAVEHYAYSLELFDSWQVQRAPSKQAVAAALLNGHGNAKPEAEQLEYLRLQIEMRVLGLGWTKYATRWSSQKDERIGTVAHLRTLLEEIIEEEIVLAGKKQLPTEAAPPQHLARELGQLGTPDADAAAIAARAVFSANELAGEG